MLDQISSVFFEEANELLDNLEEQLLSLEQNPSDLETIGAVFRAMHTIKGSSAMFGFNSISEFTHEVESAMDQVRNGIVPVNSELIGLMLKARDHIREMLECGQDIPQTLATNSQTLIIAFKTFVAQNGGTESDSAASSQPELSPEQVNMPSTAPASTFRIKFRPSKKVLQNGTRPELLVKELTEMGTATVVSFSDSLPPLSKMDSELCYFYWDIILTTQKTENDVQDVFIFLDSDSKFTIEKVELNPEDNHRIGEILVDRNDISKAAIDSIMQEHKQLGQILVEKQVISQQQVKSALAEQQHFKSLNNESASSIQASSAQSSIRVNSEKLDLLVDLIGELVTFNARLEQLAVEKNISILKNLSEQCGRLALSLRDTSMDIRMLPIGSLFMRFKRTVRDLSDQLGKKVELVIEGAETELDKTVIEKLNDPLLHLIRNSVDHGIELPLERVSIGKNASGTLKLSAKHQGGIVLITITDDGKGLDKEAIRKKGIERGLISTTDELSDSDIYYLIFQPGFSTAKQVSNISGRGVGLDVVKKDIMSLGGSVSIESTQNKGTSFILKIPLTLAIIDGMLTQIGNTKYIIPVNTISECLFFKSDSTSESQMFPYTEVHGKNVPCIDLRTFFNVPLPRPAKSEVVTIFTQEGIFGIVVDKILGNRQTVIKPLGKLYQNSLGISNSTILGDGSVALILDVFKLTDMIIKQVKGN